MDEKNGEKKFDGNDYFRDTERYLELQKQALDMFKNSSEYQSLSEKDRKIFEEGVDMTDAQIVEVERAFKEPDFPIDEDIAILAEMYGLEPGTMKDLLLVSRKVKKDVDYQDHLHGEYAPTSQYRIARECVIAGRLYGTTEILEFAYELSEDEVKKEVDKKGGIRHIPPLQRVLNREWG